MWYDLVRQVPVKTLVLYRTRVFRKAVERDVRLLARLIKPFGGGRWRLRRMRANGYGNSIVFCLQSIDFGLLKKIEEKRKSQLKASPYGRTC